MRKSNIPNTITFSRIISLPVFLVTAIFRLKEAYLIAFFTNLALDGLDGTLARLLKSTNIMGRRLDSIVDFVVLLPGYSIALVFIDIQKTNMQMYLLMIIILFTLHILMHVSS